ncbi:MAG: YggS family pyridoxal phosphate-dependent enzyme [Aquificae bacterium]|nr:YggS family pyridoxal phosphate-dependent enzyme [Aquificota bacterium]
MGECEKLQEVLESIKDACQRVGRKPEEVKLLGASKTVPPEVLRRFYECGLRTFGENRVQEFLKKYEALQELNIDWHFIGRLQTNKVKYLMKKVSLIHSLDRKSLADEIQKRASKVGITQEVLIEVNVGGEETKGGVEPENLPELFEYTLSLPNLKVVGLMTIPPYLENPEEVRPFFAKLRNLRDKLEEEFKVELPHLSMGMSHDFEVAVEEGATIVRVGTRLFGERS